MELPTSHLCILVLMVEFRHFDDFSWGETRKVEGEKKGEGHGDDHAEKVEQDTIPWKKWEEWELERRADLLRSQRLSVNKRKGVVQQSQTTLQDNRQSRGGNQY
jgi:Chitin synthase